MLKKIKKERKIFMIILLLIIIDILIIMGKYFFEIYFKIYKINGFYYDDKYLLNCNYENLSYKYKCKVRDIIKYKFKKIYDKKWKKIKKEINNWW